MIYRVFSVHAHVVSMCLPVYGDNPEALMSGLSHIQVDNHGIIGDLADYEILYAEVGIN